MRSRLALVAGTLILWAAGCAERDPTAPQNPTLPLAGSRPVIAPEPAFTPGVENTIAWRVSPAGDDWEFLVERAADPAFLTGVSESGWINGNSHTFVGLDHDRDYHYRVRGRRPGLAATGWSPGVVSRQDAVPPAATIDSLLSDQTSLLFDLELGGEDDGSGVRSVELWFRRDGGPLTLYGSFAPGRMRFQATDPGPHAFFAVASDAAGNRQDMPASPQGFTTVPEPIIIVDQLGESFDITNAVLKHSLHVRAWAHGLGRFTIRPVVDPVMIGPEHPQFLGPDSLADIAAVDLDGDARAYVLLDLGAREVVDDVVNGVPIAVSY